MHPMKSLDAAPHRPAIRPLSWVVLVVGSALLVGAASHTWQRRHAYLHAEAAHEGRLARERRQAADLKQREAAANTPAQQERSRATRQLQQMAQFAWFDLFELLERAAKEVRGGVSVVSLAPSRADEGLASMRLTAIAANQEVLFTYLRFLKDDARTAQVQLLQQEEDAASTPQAIRFQVQLVWKGIR
jgi:hypothetical protein